MPRTKREDDRIPSREECLELLKEAGCSDEVIAHCEAVSELAIKIAKRCRAKVALVEAGALLHDLGRSRTHSIDHAVLGSELAKEKGLPPEIVSIIERHVGAGILKEESVALGLPERSYVPVTLEEKIVSHADNLMDGDRRVGIMDIVVRMTRRGMRDAAFRTLRLHEELSRTAGIDIDRVL